ncbi:MAG: homoserine dehydrogenase [Anaerolinea sp.]|nr:homoserine dehydrogenase [Anaerolinea sp.]
MTRVVRLGLIGFGNVGQGLAQIIKESHGDYFDKHGLDFKITAISDARFGSLYDADGLDIGELLENVSKKGSLKHLSSAKPDWDALTLIRECNADVIVEMSYTDLKTGQPATDHVIEALTQKKHVVTTNKGPVALHYSRLEALAEANGVQIGVEGTVMSGTPTLRLAREILSAGKIRKVMGIFNGTTNYILTQMESGMSYADALAEAQKLGYAEADPTGDVEGFDAAGKVVILARLVMNEQISMEDVDRTGISKLTLEDINSAKDAGERWKLIGSLECVDGKLVASVKPLRLPITHPLAGVSGATNAAHFVTDYVGEVTLIGPGAGRLPTGYAVIEDILAIYR